MTVLVNSLKDTFKKDDSSAPLASLTSGSSPKLAKLVKPAKVPSWTKDMSLETYSKQISTWTDINEDVPEYVKYHDLIEDLKKNKEIRGL